MIPSNFTLEEAMEYAVPLEIAKVLQPLFDRVLDELAEKEEELKSLEEKYELMSEQVFFADSLIDNIEEKCKETGGKRELVKEINSLIEESMFER